MQKSIGSKAPLFDKGRNPFTLTHQLASLSSSSSYVWLGLQTLIHITGVLAWRMLVSKRLALGQHSLHHLQQKFQKFHNVLLLTLSIQPYTELQMWIKERRSILTRPLNPLGNVDNVSLFSHILYIILHLQ